MSQRRGHNAGPPSPPRQPSTADPATLFRQGLTAHEAGNLDAAEGAYRAALGQQPAHADALHHLGLIQHQRGAHQEAARLVRRSLAGQPGQAHWQLNLATIEQARGRTDAALKACERARAIDPTLPGADALRGDLLLETGRPRDAVSAYRAALAREPDDPDLLNNLGNALAAGRDHQGALDAYDAALVRRPAHRFALLNAVRTSAGPGNDPEGAIARLERAMATTGRDPELLREKAQLLLQTGAPADALACLGEEGGDARDPSAAASLRASALEALGRPDEAAAIHQRLADAADSDTRAARWLVRVGACREQAGDRAGAEAAYRRAVERDERHGTAWQGLADIGALTPDDTRIMERLARDRRLDPGHRAAVLFALGREHERRDDTDQAFAAFRQANETVARQRPFDADALARLTERIIDTFGEAQLARAQLAPAAGTVFIVGMPRSGTTLVERMLAAHPALAAGGERQDLPWLERRLRAGRAPESPDAPDAETAQALRDAYYARLAAQTGDHGRVTDKLPANYLRLGLIPLLLPDARIIHCRRNPLDTCLSCYTTHFRQGQSFSYDLQRLVTAYRLYERIMGHWQQVMPEAICEIDYETLVAEPEPALRRILAHCGLDWDARCLDFADHAAPIQTASRWQARQPVHRGSVGRWRRFRQHIEPLLRAWPEAAGEEESSHG